MFQPVTHSVNAAQPVSQQGGAQQVEPAQAAAGGPGTIRKANHVFAIQSRNSVLPILSRWAMRESMSENMSNSPSSDLRRK